MTSSEVEMKRVDRKTFWEHLDRWSLVATLSQLMPIANSSGRYAQTGYFSVAAVEGIKLIPDETNLVAAIRRSPTKSDGKRDTGYFINLNARTEKP